MYDDELLDYLSNKVSILLIENYIDYEDIENPVKSFQVEKANFQISPEHYRNWNVNFQKHTCVDNVQRFQFFGGETQKEYLNI